MSSTEDICGATARATPRGTDTAGANAIVEAEPMDSISHEIYFLGRKGAEGGDV